MEIKETFDKNCDMVYIDVIYERIKKVIVEVKEKYDQWLTALVVSTLNIEKDDIPNNKDRINIETIDTTHYVYIDGKLCGVWCTEYNFNHRDGKILYMLNYNPRFE